MTSAENVSIVRVLRELHTCVLELTCVVANVNARSAELFTEAEAQEAGLESQRLLRDLGTRLEQVATTLVPLERDPTGL